MQKIDASPNKLFFDSAMEEVHLNHDVPWPVSPRMSDMSRAEKAGQVVGSSDIPRRLPARGLFSCLSLSACWVSFRGCTLGCMHEK